MSEPKILIGADPEIFMFDKKGVPVSAHGVIRGDKKNPQKVDKGAVQVDGMALEFNIDPAEDEDAFVSNINCVMDILRGMVPDHDLRAVPVAEFGHDYIKAQPREALELGCDPDFNAWNNGEVNPRPNGNNPFRTGAGHVHIGWTSGENPYHPEHMQASIQLVKELDMWLGLPSLLYDKDSKRRTMYGAAGAFRPKPYGCEYRVLSNAWLNSPELIKWVYRNTRLAIDTLMKGESLALRFGHCVYQMTEKNPNTSLIKTICDMGKIPVPPEVA
jgi:hypothetical protein